MKSTRLLFTVALGAAVFGGMNVPTASALIIGPHPSPSVPYLSFSDSPFSGLSFSSFHLETFESFPLGGVTTINGGGVTVGNISGAQSVSLQRGGSLTDSVDADDGTINGSGLLGSSLFRSSGSLGITITFTGTLPTHAGAVWTDGGLSTVGFEAFDANGVSIGSTIGSLHATSGNSGQTDEDRFYGAIYAAGIGSIKIWNATGGGGIEIDHVQFGVARVTNATPDTGATLGALAACVLGLLALRRRT